MLQNLKLFSHFSLKLHAYTTQFGSNGLNKILESSNAQVVKIDNQINRIRGGTSQVLSKSKVYPAILMTANSNKQTDIII